jgi:chloramphenicol O-acetyltransferase type A
MDRIFDIENWDRKENYFFFKDFQEPFVGITVELDATELVNICKAKSISIHHALLYCTISAANQCLPMRLRRKDNGVIEHSSIDMGCAVMREGTSAFTFAYYPWLEGDNATSFMMRAMEITRKTAQGMPLEHRPNRTNLIYGTTLPWISFTSFSHPKKGGGHSIPRTVLGKIFKRDGRDLLPFQLEVDHALMDGIHMAAFLDILKKELNQFNL